MASFKETIEETEKHIHVVDQLLNWVCVKLRERGKFHDKTKLSSPEVDHFVAIDKTTHDTKFGTDEYNKGLEQLAPALNHHYAKNRHHPQHYPNGIKGMNIVDLTEMICDWKASTSRYKEGNLLTSIEENIKRFDISDDLACILKNTAELFEVGK